MNKKNFTEEEVINFSKKQYESGKASFAIAKEKCVLLVIDMQEEFVKPHWSPFWIPEATRQVPRIKKLIDSFRQHNLPVIYTVFSNTNYYLDRPKSGKFMSNRYLDLDLDQSMYFVSGHVVDDLKPGDNEIVIHKPSYGAFYDTPLETILKNMGVETVIICGTLTNYCCGTTARQAYVLYKERQR